MIFGAISCETRVPPGMKSPAFCVLYLYVYTVYSMHASCACFNSLLLSEMCTNRMENIKKSQGHNLEEVGQEISQNKLYSGNFLINMYHTY